MASCKCPRLLLNAEPAFRRQAALPWLVLLGFVAGGFSSAAAQVNPNQRTIGIIQGSGSYLIEGVVLSAEGEVAIGGVRLELLVTGGATKETAFTDPDGRFIFAGLNSGGYRISARHPDYRDKVERVEIYSGSIHNLRILLSAKDEARGPETAHSLPLWALQIPPEAKKEHDRGVEQLQKGKTEKAIAHLRDAIDLYPDYAGAYGLLGTAHLKMNKQDAAVEAFEKALEIDPKLPEAAFGLGAIYSAQERYGEARDYLLQARSLRPEDWRISFELGQVYLRMGQLDEAEASLRQAVSAHEEFARSHLLLINALALQEKYPECLLAMEHYLQLFPKDQFAEQVQRKHDLLKAELEKASTAPPQ
jgi:tetratricopeptide (TPR) repeat protein